jgi:hypothetical protein
MHRYISGPGTSSGGAAGIAMDDGCRRKDIGKRIDREPYSL